MTATASILEEEPADAVRRELVPTGRLRVALNVANTALATRTETDEADGIASTMAAEIAARLGCAIDFQWHGSVPSIMTAAEDGGWDIAFIAADPARADRFHFSSPLVELRATLMVALDDSDEIVDRPGRTIASLRGAGYDLLLRRATEHAGILACDTPKAALEAFAAGRTDAVAGIRPLLEQAAASVGGRVLASDFACIGQAIAVCRERPAAAAFVDDVVVSLGLPRQ